MEIDEDEWLTIEGLSFLASDGLETSSDGDVDALTAINSRSGSGSGNGRLHDFEELDKVGGGRSVSETALSTFMQSCTICCSCADRLGKNRTSGSSQQLIDTGLFASTVTAHGRGRGH